MTISEDPVWRKLTLSGTSLIEASAGTGKTWNIALLYLRLVLERKLGARQILVTTFTDAAAQELRARIRARLLDAEHIVASGTQGDADIGKFLAERCASEGPGAVRARLLLALADIDMAPISTIHGFCRRVLSDFPFDTGVPFTLGEIVDEGTLIRDCVEDFWRSRYLAETIDPLEVALVVPGGPEHLAAMVGPLLDIPEQSTSNSDAEGLRRWWITLCSSQLDELRQVVDNAGLYARKNSALRTQLRKLLEAAERGHPAGVKWKDLGQVLEPRALRDYSHGSLTTTLDGHPLLGAWSILAHAIRRAKQVITGDVAQHCTRFVRSELNHRLRVQGNTTFTHLIAEVHDRLTGPGGHLLSARLREAWPVALIDEFQDTDARQWQIFDRIYRPDEGAEDSALILIGDPKQSIYAFRGADVHAYLAARDKLPADRQFSIRQNFRSHPDLLKTLNGLYELAGDLGFGGSQIHYVPVESGKPDDFVRDVGEPGLRLRLLQCDKPGVGERDPIALETCANDIAALLTDPNSGVTPGDIAVLIDSNKRIERMRELLIERGVPVVGSGRSSVLSTAWADDLQLLLCALLQPNDEYAVRGALATRLLGATARDLTELARNAPAWEKMLDQFAGWRRMWDRRGVLAVVEAVILAQAPRLLASADGERAMTDLRHLGELLQDAATDCYGPEELYAWYVAERSASSGSIEAGREQQLRIESEARRVQLLTIHASKGLEYPVVFIPTAWRALKEHNRSVSKDLARHHDAHHHLCLDLGTADFSANKAAERLEGLQERLRVLYVATTRARTQCIAYAFEDTAPQSAVTNPDRGALETLLGAALHAVCAKARDTNRPWDQLAAAIKNMRIDRSDSASQRYRRNDSELPARVARSPLPSPRPYYGNYSFTGLTRMGATPSVDAPQWAEDEPPVPTDSLPAIAADDAPDPRLALLARIKGPRFGDALHQLLEAGRAPEALATGAHTPFAEQIPRIAAALDQQSVVLEPGREAEQLAAVAAILDRTLDSPLAPGLRLAALAPTARKPEFEFAFAIDEGQWHALHRLLAAHGLGHWWPASSERRVLRGLMKGSMDLVFAWAGQYHVLDYKASWLGTGCLSDYGPESLDVAMLDHHYGLQALIYTVALHRYLAHRLADYDPDTHLGESWYLFVRAVGLSPTAGIWRKRFPRALIESLDALFEGQELAA